MEREAKIRRQLASDLSANQNGRRPFVFRKYEELWFGEPYHKPWAEENQAFLQFLFAEVSRESKAKGDVRVSMESGYTVEQVEFVILQASRQGLVTMNVRRAEGGRHVITFRELNKYDFLNLNWKSSLEKMSLGFSESAPPALREATSDTLNRWQLVALAQGGSILVAITLFVMFGTDGPPVVYLALFSTLFVVIVALVLAGKLTHSRSKPTASHSEVSAGETPHLLDVRSAKTVGDRNSELPSEPSFQVDLEKILSSPSPEPNTLTVGLCQQILTYSGDETVVHEYVLERMQAGKGSTTYVLEEYILLEISARGNDAGKEVLRDLLSLAQLQQMAKNLNIERWRNPNPDLLAEEILKALGFKVFGPPSGIEENIRFLRAYQQDEFPRARSKDDMETLGFKVGKKLNRVLEDVLHFYCYFLWGEFYEEELRHLGFLDRAGGGAFRSLKEATLGKVTHVLQMVNVKAESDARLRDKLERQFGRKRVFPESVFATREEAKRHLKMVTYYRNYFVHDNPEFNRDSVEQVRQKLEDFINQVLQMFEDFRQSQFYPRVVRYHAASRNSAGEWFIECLQENGEKLMIRTDELMREGNSYFCCAHGNPIAIRPLLIPKEREG